MISLTLSIPFPFPIFRPQSSTSSPPPVDDSVDDLPPHINPVSLERTATPIEDFATSDTAEPEPEPEQHEPEQPGPQPEISEQKTIIAAPAAASLGHTFNNEGRLVSPRAHRQPKGDDFDFYS